MGVLGLHLAAADIFWLISAGNRPALPPQLWMLRIHAVQTVDWGELCLEELLFVPYFCR
jgi:hypothetical protein